MKRWCLGAIIVLLTAAPTLAQAATYRSEDDEFKLHATAGFLNTTYNFDGTKIEEVFAGSLGEDFVTPFTVSEYDSLSESRAVTAYGHVDYEGFAQVSVDGVKPRFQAHQYLKPLPGLSYAEAAFWGSFDVTADAAASLVDSVLLRSPGQSGFGTLLLGFESDGSLAVNSSRFSSRDNHSWRVGEINVSTLFLAESGYGLPQVVFDTDVRGSSSDPVGSDGYIPPTNVFSDTSTTDILSVVGIPFEYDVPFDLSFELILSTRILIENLDVADSFNVDTFADFANTVELVSVGVLDGQGNPDLLAIASSAAGVDYLAAGGGAAPIPVAPTALLLLPGLAALLASVSRPSTAQQRALIAART